MPHALRTGWGAALGPVLAAAGSGQGPSRILPGGALALARRRGSVLTRTRHVD